MYLCKLYDYVVYKKNTRLKVVKNRRQTLEAVTRKHR